MAKVSGKPVKVRVEELRIGMFVSDVGRGWLRHPWPTKSKLITNQEDIQQLIDFGITEVIVDPKRCKSTEQPEIPEFGLTSTTFGDARRLTADEVTRKATESLGAKAGMTCLEQVERRKKPRKDDETDHIPLTDELPQAKQTYLKALSLTHEFMNDARAGRKVEVDRVKESLNEMIDSVFRNRDAMLSLSKLRKFDEYTFSHCLNVTALVMAMGRQIKLNRGQLMDLGLAAMFHDLGKTRIPEAILNKPAKLTDEEFAIMKTHSALGEMVLLEQVDKVSPGVLRVVRHHHERMDGTGYPDGLSADKFRPGMIICAMADVYDALSSDRVYHKGMMPHEALKVVFSLRDKHFPGVWVDRFVQSLGIYPVGTVVRLNNGLVGIVVSVNHACLTKPKVRGILDPAGRPLNDPKTYDLTESSLLDWEIKKVIDPKPLGIDPAKALGL